MPTGTVASLSADNAKQVVSNDDVSREPIFILTAARSGSTLLRFYLDSLPGIAAPAETNISALFHTMRHMANVLEQDSASAHERWRSVCRSLADETLGKYAKSRNSSRWCDKSLPSALDAEMLIDLFPEAQFIGLHRDFLDFVVSAVEVCKWGFTAYGFENYARSSPDNFILALARYWIDYTGAIIEFEEHHPTNCLRIRYEDIALEPEVTAKSIASFLNVSSESAQLPRFDDALRMSHTDGPGDHKIRWTDQILSDRVGRGWMVPIEVVPAPLRERIDEMHHKLEYLPLSRIRSLPPQTDAGISAHESSNAPYAVLPRAIALFENLGTFAAHRGRFERRNAVILRIANSESVWTVDFNTQVLAEGADDTSYLQIISTLEIFDEIWLGQRNPGMAIQQGHLRLVSGQDHPPDESSTLITAALKTLSKTSHND